MPVQRKMRNAELIDRLVSESQDTIPKSQAKQIETFLRQYYRWVSPEDLIKQNILDLRGAALAHWQLARQRALGKAKVQQRIHQHNTQTKEGLAKMSHVRLYTPMSSELSSGLVCFDVAGVSPVDVVKRMHAKGIIMSNTPYRETYARFAPSLINNEQEIDQALAEIRAMG